MSIENRGDFMKKFIFIIFIFLFILVLTFIILFKMQPLQNNTNETMTELYSYNTLFFNSFETKDFEKMNNMYYKKIVSYNEYQIYKKKYDLPNKEEQIFNENFIVITTIENSNMMNLVPKELKKEKSTLKIAFFKDNNTDTNYNSFLIVISKKLEADIIEPYRAIIEKIPYNQIMAIENIPKEYTLEQAKNDNCYIVDDKLNFYNEETLDLFIDNYKNKRSSFIRMVKFYEDKEIIRDIYYNAKEDNFLICEDNTRAFNSFSYNYYKYFKLEEKGSFQNIKYYFLTSPYEEDFRLYTSSVSYTTINNIQCRS